MNDSSLITQNLIIKEYVDILSYGLRSSWPLFESKDDTFSVSWIASEWEAAVIPCVWFKAEKHQRGAVLPTSERCYSDLWNVEWCVDELQTEHIYIHSN